MGTVTDTILENCGINITACDICGETASGYWKGSAVILVCGDCAVEILPALIADAVCHKHVRPDQLKTIAKKIVAGFWRGVALNFANIARRGK